MEIKVIPIEEIKPAKYNPRTDLKPGDEVYERLKQSILRFELVEPLVWNKRTGNLVGGHQRLKVLRELGYTEVEVSVVDLDEEQEKVLNLALNKIQGEWDKEKLEVLLKELYEQDKESVYLAGFNDAELRKLVDSIAVEQSPYTYKVDSVQYLPREGARLEELCDTGKYEELLKKIEEADVSEEMRRFMRLAATRFIRFNFAKIADFYAGADADVQRIFEDLALVIVDFDDAVAKGFVEFNKKLAEFYEEEYA